MRHLVEFQVAINSDNDAFVENEAAETARILREVADDIAASTVYCEGNCRDNNGNTVGSFLFDVTRDD
jgi:hypothetical protein